jgi:hypothetical protein
VQLHTGIKMLVAELWCGPRGVVAALHCTALRVNSVVQAVSLLLVALMRLGQEHSLSRPFPLSRKKGMKPAACLLLPCLLPVPVQAFYPVCVCSFSRRNVSSNASFFFSVHPSQEWSQGTATNSSSIMVVLYDHTSDLVSLSMIGLIKVIRYPKFMHCIMSYVDQVVFLNLSWTT